MKIRILLILIILLIQISAYSQTRIRFKKGSTSATVSGKLSSNQPKRFFVIGAKVGQTLIVRTNTDDPGVNFVNVNINSPRKKNLMVAGQDGQFILNESGNYLIELTPPGRFYNAKANGYRELTFTLFVQIY